MTNKSIKNSFLPIFLAAFIILTILPGASIKPALAQAGNAYDLIASVNALRTSQGLAPLEIDGALMSSAQGQSDYQAAVGYWTHEGPGGSRPRDRAAAAGFGSGATIFVSENVAVLNPTATFDTLIYTIWSDSLHWNTMTNPNYTHAGAGITVSGDEVYYTLDVGYVAGSPGSPVPGAPTSTPGGASLVATSAAAANDVVSPVITSTPRQDGSVVHVVDLGQALWSIAIAYNTTILNIIQLNNLDPQNPSIWPGNELLIQPSLVPSSTSLASATPPPSTRTPKPTSTVRPPAPSRTATQVISPTPEPLIKFPDLQSINRRSLGIVIIAVCAAGLLAVIITGFRPSK